MAIKNLVRFLVVGNALISKLGIHLMMLASHFAKLFLTIGASRGDQASWRSDHKDEESRRWTRCPHYRQRASVLRWVALHPRQALDEAKLS